MKVQDALRRPTISVPEAGKAFYGLAKNASYDAAKSGQIPTIEVGGRKFAVVAEIAKQLGLKTSFASRYDDDRS